MEWETNEAIPTADEVLARLRELFSPVIAGDSKWPDEGEFGQIYPGTCFTEMKDYLDVFSRNISISQIEYYPIYMLTHDDWSDHMYILWNNRGLLAQSNSGDIEDELIKQFRAKCAEKLTEMTGEGNVLVGELSDKLGIDSLREVELLNSLGWYVGPDGVLTQNSKEVFSKTS